ncbi:MAG: nucleoside triphosphate pyrophosphohydrolase [Clostridia bacterium]|nr:nucleoside triphosphate pyrophosphohydrolase [Clostridia bacterium]
MEKYSFDDLCKIIEKLRAPGGCPWDAEQTHESIKKCMVEEAYEAVEAIESGDMTKVYDELGDLLLQVVMHAQIAKENGEFDIADVTNAVSTKMIRRHPHVFGTTQVNGSEEVLDNWEKIKKVEKGESKTSEGLDSVAHSLPALIRAQKVQKKASKAGFDWEDIGGAIDKIKEETAEFEEAVKNGSNTEEELGDLLFSVVNAARFAKVDSEEALTQSTRKFIKRFAKMEDEVLKSGKRLEDLSLDEMDMIWNKIKH